MITSGDGKLERALQISTTTSYKAKGELEANKNSVVIYDTGDSDREENGESYLDKTPEPQPEKPSVDKIAEVAGGLFDGLLSASA